MILFLLLEFINEFYEFIKTLIFFIYYLCRRICFSLSLSYRQRQQRKKNISLDDDDEKVILLQEKYRHI